MKKIAMIIILIVSFNASLFASYEEALKLFQEKKYKESLKILADELVVAEDSNPNSPNYKIRYLAAHNHWRLGNTKSVIDHFTKCMQINKDKVDPYIDLALFLFDIKRYNDAEDTIKKGLKIKEAPMLLYILGKIALVRQNYWRAKELFEKANSLDPELYVSYNALGIALMNLKKYSEANTAFSVALAINSNSSEILNNMGMSSEKMGKYKEAYSYYKKANSIDDNNKVILENLARVKDK